MAARRLHFALFLALGFLAVTGAARAETIASVVERVIRSNPNVGAAYYNSQSRLGAADAANALRHPRVSVSAQTGRTVRDKGKDYGSYGADLTVAQRLYDGGEVSSQIKRSAAEVNAAKGRYSDAVLVNSLLVIQTYIELQRSRQISDIAAGNLKVLTSLEQIVRQRTTEGFASEADLYHAKSTVADAREQMLIAHQQRDDAMSDYVSLIGDVPNTLDSVGAPRSAIPPTADEAVALALRHSPRIIALGYDALAAHATYLTAKSANAPKLNLNMRMNYDATYDGVETESLGGSAQVVLKFDLYDGGERKARQRQAAAQLQESKQNTLREKMNTERDVRRAWTAVVTSHGKLSALAEKVEAARLSYKLNLQRFKAGKTDVSVLLNLQAEVASSQVAYANEMAAGRYNTYRILAATGRLLMALNLEANQLGFVP
jgi:outer membrane protein, adhesin transport system